MTVKFRFISAGAGTGKTHTLMQLLHQALISGEVRPAGVLATTFTNHAATELRQRVQQHLLKQQAFALAQEMNLAQIGTVNSVCGQMLQRFCFSAGMSSQQTVLDENQAHGLLEQVLEHVIDEAELQKRRPMLLRLGMLKQGEHGNDWRQDVKKILAQARSNALSEADLRAAAVENADALLAHFPKVTVSDLSQQLLRAIDEVLPVMQEAATSSKAKKVTQTYVKTLLDARNDLERGVLTWQRWVKLSKDLPEKKLEPLAQPVIDVALRMPHHPQLHADLRQYLEHVFAAAARTMHAYAQRKAEMGVVDFADQEQRLLDILDRPEVAQTLREELQLLMVDEFQDTNPMQLALFMKLAEYAKQVVWVGDIKQAIYGFRGSDANLMQSLLAALPQLQAEKITLDTSWRSRPALVRWVNAVFADDFAPMPRADIELKPARPEIPGPAVAQWSLPESLDYASLARGIQRLLNEQRLICCPQTQQLRPVTYGDIAVLLSTNAHVDKMAQALTEQGIPLRMEQAGLLEQPECVLALACLRRIQDPQDTLATAEILALAEGQEPEVWLNHRLDWLAQGQPEQAWQEQAQGDAPILPLFQTIMELREQSLGLGPRETLVQLLLRGHLSRVVLQWSPQAEQGAQRLANLNRLLDLAATYETQCDTLHQAGGLAGLILFLQQTQADAGDTKAPGPQQAVQVLTKHKAKGLEWPVVILGDLLPNKPSNWSGIHASAAADADISQPLRGRRLRFWPWPFARNTVVPQLAAVGQSPEAQWQLAQEQAEARRLLYVSMTRARDLLIVAGSHMEIVEWWQENIRLLIYLPTDPEQPQVDYLLPSGETIPMEYWLGFDKKFWLESPQTQTQTSAPPSLGLHWFTPPKAPAPTQALFTSPSKAEERPAQLGLTERWGVRLPVTGEAESSVFGDAIHACLAADLADPQHPLRLEETQEILQRYEVDTAVQTQDWQRQMQTIRQWLQQRWPQAQAWVEWPLMHMGNNGVCNQGRADLVLETPEYYILIDYKSTSENSSRHEALAQKHGAQLAAYAEMLHQASGKPVRESWLVLPITGMALQIVVPAEATPT